MSILARDDVMALMRSGKWYHQDHFLPLAERVPVEVACRCYLHHSYPKTREMRRQEDPFDQCLKGGRDFVRRHLRELVYAGVLKRRFYKRVGRRLEWQYMLGSDNANRK